jgi:hypothetical protein
VGAWTRQKTTGVAERHLTRTSGPCDGLVMAKVYERLGQFSYHQIAQRADGVWFDRRVDFFRSSSIGTTTKWMRRSGQNTPDLSAFVLLQGKRVRLPKD